MGTKRIIPCLDIIDGRVVKGVNFEGIRDIADPVEMAGFYCESGADELVFYDITASGEGRKLFTDLLKKVAVKTSVPLIVGGGISVLDDFDTAFRCGADKISINSGALKNPGLIKDAADKYGGERVILSMDVKRADGKFMVFARGGKDNTGLEAADWAKKGVRLGAGELVINSIDTDGVKGGFDIEILQAIEKVVSVPIVASGGAGKKEDFAELFIRTKADAGLAASVFHLKEIHINELKGYLKNRGIDVSL